MNMIRFALPASLLLLAGCARTEQASLVPADEEGGYNAVEQVRTPEADDGDEALGDWREVLQDDQTALEFGPMGAAPLFSLRCDGRGGLILQRHGAVAAGDLPVMLVSVGSETRRLAVTAVGGAIPLMRAALAPSEGLVGTLADVPTSLTIRLGDSEPLVLPGSQAVVDFVGQCRGGGAPTPAADDAEAVAEEAPAE